MIKEQQKGNYKFKLSAKIYTLAIISAFVFATILSIILYLRYADLQTTFVKASLRESTENFCNTLLERYDKISSTASDISNMANFMYNTGQSVNLSKFYSFTHIKEINIYDRKTKSPIVGKNINIDKLKEGINYIIQNDDLEVYYLHSFKYYILAMIIDKNWLFKLQNTIDRNMHINLMIKIADSNKSYEITPKEIVKNTKFKMSSLREIENNYYYSSTTLKGLTIYSLLSKVEFQNNLKKRFYFDMLLIYSTSFLVTIFLVVVMNIVFVRKIKKIVSHIALIRNGKLGHQIDFKGNDEISYLAYHINSMTEKLSKMIQGQRNIIDEKTEMLEMKLKQEKELSNLIINMTQHSESSEDLLNFIHEYIINKGAKKFFHYRVNIEGNSFELLKNYNYHRLPQKFVISMPEIQKMYELYEKGDVEEIKNIVRNLCNTEEEKDIIHLIHYKNKLIGFMEIKWEDEKNDDILKQAIRTLPIIVNNIYMRESLVKTAKELREANKAKNEFLNIMSHELRTPLNAILGFTQMLLRKPDELSERQYKYVKNIYTAGSSLLDIINDILDLSKIQSGKREIQISNINLKNIISNILVIIKPLAKEKNINLKTKINLENEEVYSDEDAMKHILTNLLSNAIKYTKKDGKVELKIQSDKNKLKIQVKDTGIGIEKEKINYIFEPFKRLQKDEYANTIKGTGLGLAIVKEFIDILGGEIKVDSEVGVGSTFEVILPIKKIEFPQSIKEGECDKGILIIENNSNDIELYESVFGQTYELKIAKTLQDGVNHFKNFKPKVIILDLRLEDMSGIYLINKLNEDRRFKCTNIVVSSILKKRDINGTKYYVRKPIRDLIKFKEIIDNLMNS